jgi:alpha-tubulin suppressor-like RCC1 family protein
MGTPRLTPAFAPNLRDVAQIVMGSHACALSTEGTVRCWGSDHHGRLGVAGKSDGAQRCVYACSFSCQPDEPPEEYLFHAAPVAVEGITDIVELTAGDGHTCALSRDGRVWCWGENWQGQLGDGTTQHRNVPTPW